MFHGCIETKMRVIAKKILTEFWEKFSDSEDHLKSWYREAKKATWKNPNDIKGEYPKASILKSGGMIFNICGNQYRLVIKINYLRQWVFIRFIGTHSDYDKIDVDKV